MIIRPVRAEYSMRMDG